MEPGVSGIDAFNALMTAKKAGLSLTEVYRQQEEVHRRVIDAVVGTPDAQLARETRYRRRLRLDTYGHYPKHTETIRRWRALSGDAGLAGGARGHEPMSITQAEFARFVPGRE